MHTLIGKASGLLLALATVTSQAATVYTWVDFAGTTHFSESAPLDSTADVQRVDLQPTSGPRKDTQPDAGFFSVINQANRMESRRLEREKLDAEQEQAKAEASKARAEAQLTSAVPATPPLTHRYVFPQQPVFWHPRHHDKPAPPPGTRRPRPASPRTALGKTRAIRR